MSLSRKLVRGPHDEEFIVVQVGQELDERISCEMDDHKGDPS